MARCWYTATYATYAAELLHVTPQKAIAPAGVRHAGSTSVFHLRQEEQSSNNTSSSKQGFGCRGAEVDDDKRLIWTV